MALWSRLYNTIWLVFFTSVLIPRWLGENAVAAIVHILLGIGVIALTMANAKRLAALPVPARLPRISKVTSGIAMSMAVTGIGLGALVHAAPSQHVIIGVLRGIHVLCAFAILAQASSVATGYDMWEEKEIGGTG